MNRNSGYKRLGLLLAICAVILATLSVSASPDSWTQTTDTDFNAGTLGNVQVVGTGAAADVTLAFNDVFGDGSDGDVTITTDTTLTEDMDYQDLTVNAGVTLNTAGYTVRVSGTLTNNGIITDSVSGGAGGTGGAGGAGGVGNNNGGTGTAGNPGGSGSVAGAGAGGSGGGGGGGGAGESYTAWWGTTYSVTGGAGGTGGTGGKGGGVVTIYCYELVNNNVIHADGVDGSVGGTGGNGVLDTRSFWANYDIASGGGGGGGGGNGGNGGTVSITYGVLTTSGTLRANGGSAGGGGTGGSGQATQYTNPGGTDHTGGSGAGNGGDGGNGERGSAQSENGDPGGIGSSGASGSTSSTFAGYVSSGTFTSSTYETDDTYEWGTISWSATVPGGTTTLSFQIRTTYNGYDTGFVGPDGTAGSYYTTSGTNIWSGHDGYDTIQFKAYFTSSSASSTPTLNDVTITWDGNSTVPPIPELPPFVLFGVGLLALVGYIGYRRRMSL